MDIKKYKQLAEEQKIKREEARVRLWNNLPKFKTINDVPDLPVVEKDEWMFYVNKLIEAGAIPKKDLINGEYYIGSHRRANVARWNADKNVFEYNRYKFGAIYIDTCNHFEDDDGYALFVPIGIATKEQFDKNQI